MSISVFTSTYNHAQYLPEAIHSIFNQEIQPVEAIVIDDASTDNTVEVVEALKRQYPKLVFLRNEKNQGPAKNFNRALSIVKGKYLVGCAADDLILPGFYKRGLDYLEAHSSLAFCVGDTFHFKDQKPYQYQFLKTLNFNSEMSFPPTDVEELFRNNIFAIQSHACFYRTSCMVEMGGFIPELYSLCDWYLNVHMALRWGFGYIPHPFAAYRIATGSYAKLIGKNPNLRKSILNCLFALIERDGVGDLYKKCRLFSQFNYQYFFDFLSRPKYWNLTLPSFPKKLKWLLMSRMRRVFTSLFR